VLREQNNRESSLFMAALPKVTKKVATTKEWITHCPRMTRKVIHKRGDVTSCEKLLKEWFGKEVVLTASGRTSLHLYLTIRGFQRYKHKLEVPPFLSRCVINALTPTVFPVESPLKSDGVMLYHQYGFPQRSFPNVEFVIEDIAHSFFSTANSGNRTWVGESAIFSLQKFFPMNGLIGGIIVQDTEVATNIRHAVNSSLDERADIRDWMREVLFDFYKAESEADILVDSAFELLLKYVRPDPINLGGFPTSLEDVAEAGEARKSRIEIFKAFHGHESFPERFWDARELIIPFAIPYFGQGGIDVLPYINSALADQGVRAGIYHVDINRNMGNPDYRRCVLVPCHQEISLSDFENICRIIWNSARKRRAES
jgi:hypothetical protein